MPDTNTDTLTIFVRYDGPITNPDELVGIVVKHELSYEGVIACHARLATPDERKETSTGQYVVLIKWTDGDYQTKGPFPTEAAADQEVVGIQDDNIDAVDFVCTMPLDY